jgi:hypothetical protein
LRYSFDWHASEMAESLPTGNNVEGDLTFRGPLVGFGGRF